MAMISELVELFSSWIAAASAAIEALAGRLTRRRQISLIEGDEGMFTAKMTSQPNGPPLPETSFSFSNGQPNPPLGADWQAVLRGSRVEILLKSDHVLFRQLDFPLRAQDFLDGMIRTQIDRLTPWSAIDAVFAWSPPSTVSKDRIELTLAATSRARIQPLVGLASAFDAASLAASVESAAGVEPARKFTLYQTSLQSSLGRKINVPKILRAAIFCAGVGAAASLLAATYFGGALDAERQQLLQRIAQRRAALRLNQNAGAGSPQALLAKRKQTTPSSVIVLEAISRALPDGTYVTELRIEGDKVQVVGISQDAPSLIRLMEQSPQFARATFFAPTTRSQGDPGERFHIEVHVKPYFGSGT
jgi:general secretion pathway protein L